MFIARQADSPESLEFWGRFLTKLHRKPGEKGKKSTGENWKNPVEKLPRNCGFLSLVVVERVLREQNYIYVQMFGNVFHLGKSN